jgi:hypothetical protein
MSAISLRSQAALRALPTLVCLALLSAAPTTRAYATGEVTASGTFIHPTEQELQTNRQMQKAHGFTDDRIIRYENRAISLQLNTNGGKVSGRGEFLAKNSRFQAHLVVEFDGSAGRDARNVLNLSGEAAGTLNVRGVPANAVPPPNPVFEPARTSTQPWVRLWSARLDEATNAIRGKINDPIYIAQGLSWPLEFELRLGGVSPKPEPKPEPPPDVVTPTSSGFMLRLVDEKPKVFDIVDGVQPTPMVKLELRGVPTSLIGPNPTDLAVDLMITVTVSNEVGAYRFGPKYHRFYPFATHARDIQGRRMTIQEPLYRVLTRWVGIDDVYTTLSRLRMRPDRDPSAPSKVQKLPGETRLELTVQPVAVRMTALDRRGLPHETVIDLKSIGASHARFILGHEIDMAREIRLRIGKGNVAEWEDYAEVAVWAAKVVGWLTGVELYIDILDVGIELVGIGVDLYDGRGWGVAEGIVDIVAGKLMGPFEIFFAVPEGYRLAHEYSAPQTTVREMEAALQSLGYMPLSKFSATKAFPIWVRLRDEKVAMIDLAGIVHSAQRPKNFHISLPRFTITGTDPPAQSFAVAAFATGMTTPKWQWARAVPGHEYRVVPPPLRFQPLRVTLKVPPEVRTTLTPNLNEIYFNCDGGGRLVLKRGVVDFGWEDRVDRLVLKRPYIGLVDGSIRSIGTKAPVGVALYVLSREKKFIPAAWVMPKGTDYTLQVDPQAQTFMVTVHEGEVDVLDSSRQQTLATLPAGETREFRGADLPPVQEPPVDPLPGEAEQVAERQEPTTASTEGQGEESEVVAAGEQRDPDEPVTAAETPVERPAGSAAKFDFYATYQRAVTAEAAGLQFILRSALAAHGGKLVGVGPEKTTNKLQFFTANADGSGLTPIPLPDLENRGFGSMAVSHDGGRIFFSTGGGGQSEHIYKIESGAVTRIFDTWPAKLASARALRCTADGEQVFFYDRAGYSGDIYRINHDGSGLQRVIDDAAVRHSRADGGPGFLVIEFDVSADGSVLVFQLKGYLDAENVHIQHQRPELFVLEHGELRQLTDDEPAVEKSRLRLSADGSTLVYMMAGPTWTWHAMKLADGTVSDLDPASFNFGGAALSADGAKLFYQDAWANGGRLVSTGGGGRDLFTGGVHMGAFRSLTMSADGRRISFQFDGDAVYVGRDCGASVPGMPMIESVALARSDPSGRHPESVALAVRLRHDGGLDGILQVHVSLRSGGRPLPPGKAPIQLHFLANDEAVPPDTAASDGIFTCGGRTVPGKVDAAKVAVRVTVMDKNHNVTVADTPLAELRRSLH